MDLTFFFFLFNLPARTVTAKEKITAIISLFMVVRIRLGVFAMDSYNLSYVYLYVCALKKKRVKKEQNLVFIVGEDKLLACR